MRQSIVCMGGELLQIQDAIEGFLLDLRAKHRSYNTLRHYEHKLRI
jgi:hypothetical protein